MWCTTITEYCSATKKVGHPDTGDKSYSQQNKPDTEREGRQNVSPIWKSQIFEFVDSGSWMTFAKVGEGGNGKLLGKVLELSVFRWASRLPYSWVMNPSLLSLLVAHWLSLAHSCVPPVSASADTWLSHCVSVSSSGHLLRKTLVILFWDPVCFRMTSSYLVTSSVILLLNELRVLEV